MSREHQNLREPFSDLHLEDGKVRATLLHDPTVEGLDMALYLDGSASMSEEYEYKRKTQGFWDWFFGNPKPPPEPVNMVEPQVRWMLEYLATKDRNGLLRVAYWASGNGKAIEPLGELRGKDVASYRFPGPRAPGQSTYLAPAMMDYLSYLEAMAKQGAKQGCAVFVTDGQIHDTGEVKKLTLDVARRVARGNFPRTSFILVGVGDDVREEQMEEIAHVEVPGVGHMWCHRVAEEITQVAELVAVLVDESMTVAAGGTITDDRGNVLRVYEGRLPAVLEFSVPEGAKRFTLEVNGQRFEQELPEEEDHH